MSASLVALRVELPTYSHSFLVHVPLNASVLDVKEEIQRTCAGAPRAHGQRLIWRGRYLKDEEVVGDIWTTPDEPRVVHLSVHPTSWTSAPPTVHQSFAAPPVQAVLPEAVVSPEAPRVSMPLARSMEPVIVTSTSNAMRATVSVPNLFRPQRPQRTTVDAPYIRLMHEEALRVLTEGGEPLNVAFGLTEPQIAEQRALDKAAVEGCGYEWPAVLDECYPATQPDDGDGVRYEKMTIDGKDYLNLATPTAQPTVQQAHALKVLTHTFPLIKLPARLPASASSSRPTGHTIFIPTPSNVALQDISLTGAVRAAQGQPNAPNLNVQVNAQQQNRMREVNLRPLILPLFMLAMRSLLLLYFISPTRKPLLGAMISAWILYEMWGHVRLWFAMNGNPAPLQNAPRPANDAGRAAAGGDQAAAPPRQGQAPAPAGPVGQAHARQPAPRRPGANQDAVLETLGNLNFADEEAALRGEGVEPTLAHKVGTFGSLLLLTLHPAVWNRRRTALRQREGRLRVEANAMEREPEEGEDERQVHLRERLRVQHQLRPAWVRAYVERVRRSEWVDDA